ERGVSAWRRDGRRGPPADMTTAEASTWKAVIASRKAGHFGPELFPLVELYCATAMACDHVAARLRAQDGIDHALVETHGKLTDSLVSLAEALDLLPGAERVRDPCA